MAFTKQLTVAQLVSLLEKVEVLGTHAYSYQTIYEVSFENTNAVIIESAMGDNLLIDTSKKFPFPETDK